MLSLMSLISALIITAPPQVQFLASSPADINGLPMGDPQGLATSPDHEEFLVADNLNDRVIIFDTAGSVVFSFSLDEGRHSPFGIAVNSMDEIVLSPIDGQELWVYDYGGRFLNDIALPDGVFPGRLAIDRDDLIYLTNRGGHEVLAVDKSGKLQKKFSCGDDKCQPSGVSFDRKWNVVLTSSAGDAASAFSSDGKIIYSFGEHGQEPGQFSHPTSCLVDNSGWFWIVDSFRHHITRYDPNHKFVDVYGVQGSGPGEFFYPVDIKMTPGGKMGILEKGLARLQIFRVSYEK